MKYLFCKMLETDKKDISACKKSVTDKRKIFQASKQKRTENNSQNITGSERLKQLQERDIKSIQNNLENIDGKISLIQQRVETLEKKFISIR